MLNTYWWGFVAVLKDEVFSSLGILSLASLKSRVHIPAKVEQEKAVMGPTSSGLCSPIEVT